MLINLNMRNDNSILYEVKQAMIHFPIYPCLSMISYTDSIFLDATKDCPCKDLLTNCYSISLKMPAKSNFTNIFGILFPASPKIQINTCTFFWHSISTGMMYCPEIRNLFYFTSEFPIILKNYVKRFFVNDNNKKSCMILLGNKQDYPVLINFISSLRDWFPDSKISFWGGAINEITICNTINKQRYCRTPVNLTCYFISSKNLQTWTITWPANDTTEEMIKEKLINFKQRIKFKQNSLGLIFISDYRPNCSSLFEINTFREIFPKIPYFYLNSDITITGEGLEDIKKIIYKWKYLGKQGPLIVNNEETSIMILTY
ncbi:hypothetical protein M0804_009679 [Polistes exclamans]|nr:hypothetical protein M0804_009679 [Polistes exclamans]